MSGSNQKLRVRLTAMAGGLGQPCGLRWLVLACLLAASLAMPDAARAASKSYPGAMCVVGNKTIDWGLNGGGLFNRNPPNRELARVDCPVGKDRPGSVITSAAVFVVDTSPQNAVCELVGVEGTNERLGPIRHSAGSISTPQRLDLVPFSPPSFGSSWFIACTLPSGSGILAYELDQQ